MNPGNEFKRKRRIIENIHVNFNNEDTIRKIDEVDIEEM